MTFPFFDTLVPALLHTLWIGFAVEAGLFAALQGLPVRWCRLRYAVCLGALLTVFTGGLITWEWLSVETPPAVPAPSQSLSVGQPAAVYHEPESEVQPLTSKSLSAKPVHAKQARWTFWLGIGWLTGAGLSLLRLIGVSFSIRTLVCSSRVVDHPIVLRLVAALSQTAGISRRILLRTGELVLQPSVAGIFRPTIFLPLSVLTGLPEWQLRAILAHELAHIVRNDFLVNVLQLLAETLLFFNPAIWWINRCIREEREACCDSLAAQWIESNYALAETLIEQASEQYSALPAFGNADTDTLKNRILRLVNPLQKPGLKLPWKSLLIVVFFATGGLILAERGTSEAVGFLKRLHALNTAFEKVASPLQVVKRESINVSDTLTFEVTIRTEDGSPLNLPIHMTVHSGITATFLELNEQLVIDQSDTGITFRYSLDKGNTGKMSGIDELSILHQGFAPYKSVGAAANAEGVVHLPPITLRRGFEGKIRFVTPAGDPVSGVKVNSIGISLGSGWSSMSNYLERVKSEDSLLKIEHCNQNALKLSITPPDGYVNETRDPSLEKGRVFDWV